MVELRSREALVEYTAIHSSVPESVNPQGGFSFPEDEKREKILVYLSAPHRRGQWRTAYIIAKECGYPTSGTQEQLRKAIKEIDFYCVQRNKPFFIVSDPSKGFMYTEDKNAVRMNILRERSRASGLRKSIGVAISWFLENGGEMHELDENNEEE